MEDAIRSLIPLSSAVLHILLALLDQERHGYGIVLEVERQSKGRYKIGPGTLYDNLEKLIERGLVEVSARPPRDDARRRGYYRLTDFGRRVLAEELSRLEGLVREARAHIPDTTGETA
jgi:DNA-binding PadR family transcriptional regulator